MIVWHFTLIVNHKIPEVYNSKAWGSQETYCLLVWFQIFFGTIWACQKKNVKFTEICRIKKKGIVEISQ